MADKSIVVIFGAGASHDCFVNHNRKLSSIPVGESVESSNPKLPLTDGLFDLKGYEQILSQYRGAETIGHIFKRERSNNEKLTFEEFLKQLLRKTQDVELQRNIREVPIYLREIIGTISNDIRIMYGQTGYLDIVDYLAGSDYQKIVLITLNWDLLLDWALEDRIQLRFKDSESYVRSNKRWFYVKLHGSVDWVRKLNTAHIISADEDALHKITSIGSDDEIFKKGQFVIDRRFEMGDAGHFKYPIMVLPHAEQKKHICPDEHISAVTPILEKCEEAWIIGNSMNDGDIVELMKKTSNNVSKVKVVDAEISKEQRNHHRYRIKQCFPKADLQEQYMTFKVFAESIRESGAFTPSFILD